MRLGIGTGQQNSEYDLEDEEGRGEDIRGDVGLVRRESSGRSL